MSSTPLIDPSESSDGSTKPTTRQRVQKARSSLCFKVLQMSIGSILAILIVGLFSVYTPVWANDATPPVALTNFERGSIWTATTFGATIVFSPFNTAYLSLHVLLTVLLAWTPKQVENSKGKVVCQSFFSMEVLLPWFVLACVQCGMWFLVAYIGQWLFPASDRTLAYTSVLAGAAGGTVFFFETLGKLLIDLVVVFSAHYNGVWGSVGNALAVGVLVAALTPLTGGSLNLWRTIAVHTAEGALADIYPWALAGSELLAPFLAVFLKRVFFPTPKAETKKQN